MPGRGWGRAVLERERDFKEELVHTILEASKTKICRVASMLETEG